MNIRNDDIADGNPKLTLGLIWTIILHFQVDGYPPTIHLPLGFWWVPWLVGWPYFWLGCGPGGGAFEPSCQPEHMLASSVAPGCNPLLPRSAYSVPLGPG